MTTITTYRIVYYQTVVDSCESLRTALRAAAQSASPPARVLVVSGSKNPAPRLAGQQGYWTTPSGNTIVRYPNAYRWPKTYHCSTLRVEVHVDWIAAHMMDILRPARTVPCRPEIMGPRGQDDRVSIRRPRLLARSAEGMLICDRPRWWDARTVVQIVVTDPTTGYRHHIGVPPEFCRPLAGTEAWSDRIHAAIAWTFALPADEYRPELVA